MLKLQQVHYKCTIPRYIGACIISQLTDKTFLWGMIDAMGLTLLCLVVVHLLCTMSILSFSLFLCYHYFRLLICQSQLTFR
jgi:hypothetical protein